MGGSGGCHEANQHLAALEAGRGVRVELVSTHEINELLPQKKRELLAEASSLRRFSAVQKTKDH